jgi:hypothetical protein
MVFEIRIFQMFLSAPFTHLLTAGIAEVLTIFLTIFYATFQKMLACAEL